MEIRIGLIITLLFVTRILNISFEWSTIALCAMILWAPKFGRIDIQKMILDHEREKKESETRDLRMFPDDAPRKWSKNEIQKLVSGNEEPDLPEFVKA